MTPASAPSAPAPTHLSPFAAALIEHFRAGYQFLNVHSAEEYRVEEEIKVAIQSYNDGLVGERAGNKPIAFVTWDEVNGFEGNNKLNENKANKQPHVALESIGVAANFNKTPTIIVMRDLDEFYMPANGGGVRRRIRNLVVGNTLAEKENRRMVIVISPAGEIHPRIRAHVSTLEFNLPDDPTLAHMLAGLQIGLNKRQAGKGECDPELKRAIIQCLRGLTYSESENCIARCIVRYQGFKPDMLPTIKDEKAAIVKKSEMLTYIPESNTVEAADIGGYGAFLTWLRRRKKAYAEQARALKIDYPRGVVLLGPPGTGKSVVAALAGKILGLPVYIFDLAAVFDKHVGSSEQRMRDVIKQVDAQRGCVLLIDEMDKALGGSAEASGDSGVTRRVLGALLTWLTSKTSPTFVIATVNRTAGLPPELLRAGRFDGMFYTATPTPAEVREILTIHLRKRDVDPDALGWKEADWKELTENRLAKYLGAEIEEVVKESRYLSFDRRQSGTPTFDELIEAAASVVPLSTRDPEAIAEIMKYCDGKAKPVNDLTTVASPQPRRRTTTRDID